MSKFSKYNEISTKKVKREKRTIKMPGSQEYDGRFYRCWNCGQINDINRNAIGDGDGMTYSITVSPSSTFGNGPTVLNMQNSGNTVLINSTGLAFHERHDIGGTASTGCSFCGCKNYR